MSLLDIDDFIGQEQRRAISNAALSTEDNPDDAARALELSKATGTDPSLIYGDLDGFQQQHKAGLAGDIVDNNKFIQNYINSHPMAAKVSNDDYGQLDTISDKLKTMMGRSVLGHVANYYKNQMINLTTITRLSATKKYKLSRKTKLI